MAKAGFGMPTSGKMQDHRLPCPKCGEKMSLSMLMPKKRLIWRCDKCNHQQFKIKNDFKQS